MAAKPFYVDYQTRIIAQDLNTISDTVWDALGQAKTPEDARTYIGAIGDVAAGSPGAYLRIPGQWVSASTALLHNDLTGRSANDAHPISAITGLDAHLASLDNSVATIPTTASQVPFVPASGIASNNVQAAIVEVSGDIPTTASQIANVPAGGIAAINVQLALNELDTEKAVAATVNAALALRVSKTSDTGSALIPSGTDAQRDGAPAVGAMRFNSTATGWEGWNGTNWVSIGGGQMYGQAVVKAIFYNNQTIDENLTVKAGQNGGTFGPVTVNNGIAVTVENGSTWSIV